MNRRLAVCFVLVVAAWWMAAACAADLVPPASAVGRASGDWQRLLLNPMDDPASVSTGGWRMKGTFAAAAEQLSAKLGRSALTLGAAEAEQAGAKGDFRACEAPPAPTPTVGLWVHLAADANVASVGIQVVDARGETLMATVPADWSGWKWIEMNLATAKPAYPQADQNAEVDYPVRSVHVVWFTRAAGPTELAVDGLVALAPASAIARADVAVDLALPEAVDAGSPVAASVLATNFGDRPARVTVRYSLQRDPALFSRPLPDPVFGSDTAAGSRSWLVIDGEKVDDSASTDGLPWTAATTPWNRGHYTEAFQLVDLGGVRTVRKLTWLSGDANHAWLVDVLASQDGEHFIPVPGLSGVDQYKKWGWNTFPLEKPVAARVLKFRQRTAGKPEDLIAFPSELGVYDGAEDETVALPRTGPAVEDGVVAVDVPARSLAIERLPLSRPLEPGAYLLGLAVEREGPAELSYRHVFCSEEADLKTPAADARIGMNAARAELAPRLRELGVQCVRFENGKWPFVSPEPHRYAFTGEVAPWHLNLDAIYRSYHDAGMEVLTYLFLTPAWATSAPADAPPSMRQSFPPKDLALYGEFCFQMAARYGSKEHPPGVLLSADKLSGLNLVKHYEMWNEPNLNPSPTATWGGWAAPMEPYYEMMRHGAEAVKRADPDAVVTSAGYAGMTTDVVDPLRTYRYPDGKRPLDFVDVINVHFYSGQQPPETCTTDGNANVTSAATFPENLRELAEWRDRHAPGKPIWMTETGYDSAGPFGTTEAIQAARLPRVVMLCLAHGVEKVFVYRESGSTPSRHACSGVLRDDFTRKPSWYTLGTAIRQLDGVRGGARRLPHPDPKVWLLEWDAGGRPLVTAWTVDGEAPLGIDLGGCRATDAFGGSTALGGTADVQVTPYPQYFRDFAGTGALQRLRAEADRLEAVRQARLERIAALRKYLFDFGSTEHVGRSTIEGCRTDYAAVLADTVWDDARGYGFDKPALGDDDQPWLGRQKLQRDGTRVRDHAFRFRVAPGRYDLTLGVTPFSDRGQLTISGVVGGPLTMAVEKKSPVQTLQVEAAGDSPQIAIQMTDGYAHFRWLSCIETLESAAGSR